MLRVDQYSQHDTIMTYLGPGTPHKHVSHKFSGGKYFRVYGGGLCLWADQE